MLRFRARRSSRAAGFRFSAGLLESPATHVKIKMIGGAQLRRVEEARASLASRLSRKPSG
jgi:hypothetical protein